MKYNVNVVERITRFFCNANYVTKLFKIKGEIYNGSRFINAYI